MNGVTIIETEKFQELLDQLKTMMDYIHSATLKSQPLLSIAQVAEMTGLSKSTIERIKADIGYTTIGGCYRFKRTNVDLHIEENSLEPKRKAKTSK
jgi:excisionase family DNA binding protein